MAQGNQGSIEEVSQRLADLTVQRPVQGYEHLKEFCTDKLQAAADFQIEETNNGRNRDDAILWSERYESLIQAKAEVEVAMMRKETADREFGTAQEEVLRAQQNPDPESWAQKTRERDTAFLTLQGADVNLMSKTRILEAAERLFL